MFNVLKTIRLTNKLFEHLGHYKQNFATQSNLGTFHNRRCPEQGQKIPHAHSNQISTQDGYVRSMQYAMARPARLTRTPDYLKGRKSGKVLSWQTCRR